jgi:adenylate cyclase
MKDNSLKYLIAILLGIAASFLIFRIDFLQRIELFLYNLRSELKVNKPVPDNIVLITIDAETQKKYGNNFIPYSEYAALIKIIGNAGVIGIDIPFIQFTDLNDIQTLSAALKQKDNIILSSQFIGGIFQNFEHTVTYVPPIPMFSQYASYGYHNYVPDIDGFVRRTAFYYSFKSQDRIEESFSSLVARKFTGKQEPGDNRVYFINYYAKSGSFKNYSFKEIIENPEKFQDNFAGKIVIVGSRFDTYKIPFIINNEMSRAEINANNIATILNNNFIKKSNILFNTLLLLLMIILGVYAAVFFSRRKGSIIISIVIGAYTVLNFIAFNFNLYLSLFTPVLGTLLSFSIIKYYLYDYRNKEIIRIRNIFRPYLAPQMLDEVIRKKDYLETLKGERRTVTVIFSDIADFTVLSERLPTDEVVNILNEFLTHMTNVIFRNNGTLDKYTGDGIMAVFGNIGKVDIKTNVYRAVKTAIEMALELEILQKKWINSGLMPLQIRIGVCTGEVIVGNIGSPQQKELTVIGDSVNTASRLEELNKKLNTSTLISRSTYEYVKDEVKVKPFGLVSLKGKNEQVEIFELLGWKEEVKSDG